jgi:mannose-6-phosphate isomerase-like protein (cupin superfamily)
MSFSGGGIILGPGEGKTINVPGIPITLKATKADTGGAYTLTEEMVIGEGPPQHIHKVEDEAFYVLEGEVGIKIGEQIVQGVPGSFVLVPRGTVHTFWNVGITPAKVLSIISPAGFEQFLAEAVGDEDVDEETFVARAMAIAEKYNFEITGPPLGK